MYISNHMKKSRHLILYFYSRLYLARDRNIFNSKTKKKVQRENVAKFIKNPTYKYYQMKKNSLFLQEAEKKNTQLKRIRNTQQIKHSN